MAEEKGEGASVSACLGRKVCVKTSQLHCTCHAHPAARQAAASELQLKLEVKFATLLTVKIKLKWRK